jgi:hypothetical protein
MKNKCKYMYYMHVYVYLRAMRRSHTTDEMRERAGVTGGVGVVGVAGAGAVADVANERARATCLS